MLCFQTIFLLIEAEAYEIGLFKKIHIPTFLNFLGAAGKKNRQKERRLMKGFNLSAGGAGGGGSVSTPLTGTGPAGGPGIPGTGSGGLVPGQSGSPLTLPSNKKSSLTIAPAEIMIDMSAPKKSPMQR